MTTAIANITTVTATGETRRDVEGSAPVFRGASSHIDGRVSLPDGTLAYEIQGVGYVGLYTHAVALDAGSNVIRRRSAAQDDLHGVSAPSLAHQALTLVGENLVGYLDPAEFFSR